MKTRYGITSQAFTLVELLVVMAIISLLLGLSSAGLSKARQAARRVACQAQLHGVGVALRMYLDDYNDIMPVAARMPTVTPDQPRIADVLKPYSDNPELLRCTADKGQKYFNAQGSSYEYNTRLSGQQVEHTFLAEQLGTNMTYVMYDYEPFHGKAATAGACNYLFADGHVGDLQ